MLDLIKAIADETVGETVPCCHSAFQPRPWQSSTNEWQLSPKAVERI